MRPTCYSRGAPRPGQTTLTACIIDSGSAKALAASAKPTPPRAARLFAASSGLAIVIPEMLDIGVDAVFDLTSQDTVRMDLHGGLTVRALQIVLIRAGYYGDRGFIDNYVTWGLGLKIPTAKVTFNVDFGMRIEVGPMDGPLRADKREGFQRIYNSIGAALSF